MRLKSYSTAVPDGVAAIPIGRRLARGRAAKIQNNCVSVTIGGRTQEFYVELQPLQRKDAASIAYALWLVVDDILRTVREGVGPDVVVRLAPLRGYAACKLAALKAEFDGKKGKVLKANARDYVVELLEGPAKGTTHKYPHNMVTPVLKPASRQKALDDLFKGKDTAVE
ncbi:unnamed protein product [Prorocentrum cordatum]|uniref:Uncharacterized protein n=1 Tax=Prorocentrum cordatum TaxID=2364126 RepID=A0ABN9TPT6_9DINO|nr:unnamed protein product [Polarella glacialis]